MRRSRIDRRREKWPGVAPTVNRMKDEGTKEEKERESEFSPNFFVANSLPPSDRGGSRSASTLPPFTHFSDMAWQGQGRRFESAGNFPHLISFADVLGRLSRLMVRFWMDGDRADLAPSPSRSCPLFYSTLSSVSSLSFEGSKRVMSLAGWLDGWHGRRSHGSTSRDICLSVRPTVTEDASQSSSLRISLGWFAPNALFD